MNARPTDLPRRIGFCGQDGAMYSITRITKDGKQGILIDRTDPNDINSVPESFFVPESEIEDLSDAIMALRRGNS